MNAVSIPGSEELDALSPSFIEIVQWSDDDVSPSSNFRATPGTGHLTRADLTCAVGPTCPSPNFCATPGTRNLTRADLTCTAGPASPSPNFRTAPATGHLTRTSLTCIKSAYTEVPRWNRFLKLESSCPDAATLPPGYWSP
ncbi:hypothetical protein AVEN_221695-1 [Araneus ventricosus]|uniref:Uncharacterized protein n=1 Tax=Araneus ventricosus TaxID=182803 RepID=A0A4Y2W296_ARAVE|nr:hypothetical protein AVEN_205360-1 [Araneus ventricosus]GBO30716.1 hypothetical protein AVEN_221695-1 [Araneus ventricosus]